jgi:hypothetical protein
VPSAFASVVYQKVRHIFTKTKCANPFVDKVAPLPTGFQPSHADYRTVEHANSKEFHDTRVVVCSSWEPTACLLPRQVQYTMTA